LPPDPILFLAVLGQGWGGKKPKTCGIGGACLRGGRCFWENPWGAGEKVVCSMGLNDQDWQQQQSKRTAQRQGIRGPLGGPQWKNEKFQEVASNLCRRRWETKTRMFEDKKKSGDGLELMKFKREGGFNLISKTNSGEWRGTPWTEHHDKRDRDGQPQLLGSWGLFSGQ